MIIGNGKQAVKFSAFGLLTSDFLGDLDIQLFVLTGCDKVDFPVCCFTDVNSIASSTKFKINNVLKACSYGVGIVAENTIP